MINYTMGYLCKLGGPLLCALEVMADNNFLAGHKPVLTRTPVLSPDEIKMVKTLSQESHGDFERMKS